MLARVISIYAIGIALSGESPSKELLAQFPAGVGLIRGEYIQRLLEKSILQISVQNYLVDYVQSIAEAVYPRPVWYRLSDLVGHEYTVLAGNPPIPAEKIPLMGLRGIRRLIRYPDLAAAELNAFQRAREGHSNLHLLVPFVSTVEEAQWIYDYAQRLILDCQLGFMTEVPAALWIAPQIFALGYSHTFFGCNDMWAFMMAETREPRVFPHATPALEEALHHLVQISRKYNASVHMGGYLNSALREMAIRCEVDALIVHYSQLPQLDNRYADLPELGLLNDIKQRSYAAQAALQSTDIIN